ncbi:MAG: flagellar hook-basal body complex protein FliE [Sphingomonas sp.]
MSIGALDATSAYGKVAGLGSALSKPTSKTGGGFADMVEDMVTGTADQMRTAEKASAQQVAGKGDLIDVVTAIGAAENALDTMVAVRDRVVGAYTDIMRMQI